MGPFSLVADIIGDVLFYLQPEEKHPAAIATKCKDRLQAALNYVERSSSGKLNHSVVVLAHSQGSVIAADLRKDGHLHYPLITAGSPIGSVYLRFFGRDLQGLSTLDDPWINCYRDGDVIGGPIATLDTQNKHLGPGGHTDYWSDDNLARLILSIA